MKLTKDYFKNDTLLINRDGMLYYEDVYKILVFGKWVDAIKEYLSYKYSGIYIYRTDLPYTVLAYVTNDEILPVIEKIDGFGEYVVLEQMEYEDLLSKGIISEEYDERFREFVNEINKMIEIIDKLTESTYTSELDELRRK